MANPAKAASTQFTDPAMNAEAIVVNTAFTETSRGIYVGVTGDVTVNMAGSGAAIQFKAVPAGAILPIRATKVTAATAADMVCLW